MVTNITRFFTFFKIDINDINEHIEDLVSDLSSEDYKTKEAIPMGYFYDEEANILRVPAGVGIDYIADKLNYDKKKIQNSLIDFTENVSPTISFQMVSTPYNDKQSTVINDVLQHFKKGYQHIIDMRAGSGKTFTAIHIAQHLGRRPAIFVSRTLLKEQWVEAYSKHTNIKDDKIFYSEGPMSIMNCIENRWEYDVYILTHRAVSMFINEYGYKEFNKFFIRNNIGMKIFDEYDTEVSNMLRVDCYTNIPYTLYLSATTFKSSRHDDRVFQNIFSEVPVTGQKVFTDYKPKRKCILIYYKSKATPKEYRKCFTWDNQFNRDKYHSFLFNSGQYKVPFEVEGGPLEDLRKNINNDDFKAAIYVGKIDNCTLMAKALIEDYGFSPDDVGIFNSDIKAKDRDINLNKKIVVTTSQSFGRGVDVKDLEVLINFEYFSSLSIFEQLVGRVGRFNGKEGRVYDMLNFAYLMIKAAYQKRKKRYGREFNELKFINMIEGETK